MQTDKLRQHIRSELLLQRANKAVAEAVGELEAKGIKPTYITRQRQAPSHPTNSDGEEQQ